MNIVLPASPGFTGTPAELSIRFAGSTRCTQHWQSRLDCSHALSALYNQILWCRLCQCQMCTSMAGRSSSALGAGLSLQATGCLWQASEFSDGWALGMTRHAAAGWVSSTSCRAGLANTLERWNAKPRTLPAVPLTWHAVQAAGKQPSAASSPEERATKKQDYDATKMELQGLTAALVALGACACAFFYSKVRKQKRRRENYFHKEKRREEEWSKVREEKRRVENSKD